MSPSLTPTFTLEWQARCFNGYRIDMRTFRPNEIAPIKLGTYALVSDRQIEFGCTRDMKRRMTERRSSDRWASSAHILELSGLRHDDAACVETWCIDRMDKTPDPGRALRNFRGRGSIGRLFYPARMPVYELGQMWLTALLGILEAPSRSADG